MKHKIELLVWLFVGLWLGGAGRAAAQGTYISYQGRLVDAGSLANGTYDFQFKLYDGSGTNAHLVAGPILNPGTGVTNGLFLAYIDFGGSAFPGAARWLGVGVRTNGSTNAYVALTPFQLVTAVPYTITAGNLTGALPVSQLSGTLPDAMLVGTYSAPLNFSNPSNQFTGDGGGLSNLNAATLTGHVLPTSLNSVPVESLTGIISTTNLPFQLTNTAFLTANQSFAGSNGFLNPANSFTGSYAGNGGGLTNVSGISNFAISVQMLQPSVAGRLGPPLFGDGSDGNVTIGTVSNLVRDMFYSNLTVNASGVLNTSGFRVFVFGTCTVTAPGVIQHNGGDGNLGTAGQGATTNTVGGGAAGAAGGTGSSGLGGNAGIGAGGVGGSGGAGGFPGSAGGTVTAIPATNGGPIVLKTFPTAFSGRDLSSGIIAGGSGGGSGGGAGGVAVGGAGGGGGGMLILAAPLVTGTGTIQAKGGAGGSGASNGGQFSGGGGGGGGGCVVIISEQAPVGVTFSVAGGLGGGSPIHVGTNGAPGNIFLVY